jgi:hypothetical protein
MFLMLNIYFYYFVPVGFLVQIIIEAGNQLFFFRKAINLAVANGANEACR